MPEDRRRLWSPADPFLYHLDVALVDPNGIVVDRATCYAGLRGISIQGPAIKLNGEPIFQRLVLDQGYYPDGILTAPTDEALRRDIELSMAAGFNGARLHQKVFEERFLYHADRLGYLVWGEFADWGCNGFGPDGDNQQPGATYITQWLEALERDYSHPSIIGWCPLNETWQLITDRITVLDDVTRGLFLATKAMDQTRPVLDTSGYSHRVPEADVHDSHDYEQNPEKFAALMAPLADGKPYANMRNNQPISIPYRGQPYFCSEFGGTWWNPDARRGRGFLGLRRPAADARRVLRALRGVVRRAARQSADVRLLLHPAHRRLPGAERHLPLRPPAQVRSGAAGGDPGAQRGDRAVRAATPAGRTGTIRGPVRRQGSRCYSAIGAYRSRISSSPGTGKVALMCSSSH